MYFNVNIIEAQNRVVKSKNVNTIGLPNKTIDTSLAIANDILADLGFKLNIMQTKRVGKVRPDGWCPWLIELINAIDAVTLIESKFYF